MFFLLRIRFLLLISLFLTSIYAHEQLIGHNKFTISTIYSKSLNIKLDEFSALANYLENNNTKNLKFDIKLITSSAEAIKLINASLIDIFIDSLYPTKIVQEAVNLRVSSKNWKNNNEGYRSVIFVKKDSDIKSLKDLKNKTIAFEDKFSTSAYYIPKRAIEKSGIKVDNERNNESVHYIFALSEKNCAAKVLFGKVDAGAIDNESFKELNKDLFRVIYTSELIPRRLISFSDYVPKDIENEILKLLYNLDKTEEGRNILKIFSKFTPLQIEDKLLINEGLK